eukprot:5871380-Pleurochrysis_carterae.AAC.1
MVECSVRWFTRTKKRCELVVDGVEVGRCRSQAFDRAISVDGAVVSGWHRRDRDARPFKGRI